MRLLVVSHKTCRGSPSGRFADGGFPLQMRALAELFDETVLLLPEEKGPPRSGDAPITGRGLSVLPLGVPRGRGIGRKLLFPLWLLGNLPRLLGAIRRADAVHAAVPGDVGTAGMLLAALLRKPLFVRHCGNWARRRTIAERFWPWFMERLAGGRNVMFATGGGAEPPSRRNGALRWIFSTTLRAEEVAEGGPPRAAPRAEGPRLILVCRMERGKGADLAVAALPLLAARFPGIALDLVGEGGELGALRDLALALGVADRVRFHGQVGQARVRELLAGADLFCFPTASEGFPKAVVEALAAGLPVVATPVSVLPLLLAGGGGVLLERPLADSLAEAIALCLSDGARYAAMSRSARETARRFTLERWRDEIGAALSKAWGGPLSL